MTEYIKRKALLESVKSIDWYSVLVGKLITGAKDRENALYKANDIYAAIDNAPASDVAPVRHGRWIFGTTNNHGWMKCSKCLVSQTPNGCFTYCPNCGAKMDGGKGVKLL